MTAGEVSDLFAEAGSFFYGQWAASCGLDPLGDGAPDQDPDGDGLLNQGEFDLHRAGKAV